MDISVIIVNYNTPQLTLQCVESIYKHTDNVSFEIIVVDNCSADNSVELLSSNKKIKLIRSAHNLGFGKANNLGYKYAKGKYIFLLNSDTLLLNNALKEFYDSMENLPQEVACIGCRLLDQEGNITKSIGKWKELSVGENLAGAILAYLPFVRRKRDNLARDNYNLLNNNEPFVKVDVIIGADMFIRRSVIEKLGLFDPRFFMYTEESDLQRTYHENGYICGIVQGPRIIHLEGKSAPSAKRKFMHTAAKFTYFKKWESPVKYYLYRVIFLLLRIPATIIDWRYSWREKRQYLRLLFSKAKDDSKTYQ